jgi:hypothetical protein
VEKDGGFWGAGDDRRMALRSRHPNAPVGEILDMAAANAFFRSAQQVTGATPARVTTDGHDSYPRAIRTELGASVKHRTNRYLNNQINKTIAGSKANTDLCGDLKVPTPPIASVEVSTSSAIGFIPVHAATKTLQTTLVGDAFFSAPSLHSASWNPLARRRNEPMQIYSVARMLTEPLQAMASGVPVVADTTRALPEFVGPDGGILVSAHDATRVADAFVGLLASLERRRRLGASARRLSERYCIGTITDEWEAVYRSLTVYSDSPKPDEPEPKRA